MSPVSRQQALSLGRPEASLLRWKFSVVWLRERMQCVIFPRSRIIALKQTERTSV